MLSGEVYPNRNGKLIYISDTGTEMKPQVDHNRSCKSANRSFSKAAPSIALKLYRKTVWTSRQALQSLGKKWMELERGEMIAGMVLD